MPDIRDRWPLTDRPEIGDRLIEAYDDPRRGYHNLQHLAEVLDRIDAITAAPSSTATPRTDAVLLAAWFHDAVYDQAGDNEERSAQLAESELSDARLPTEVVDEVARLVRLTATHQVRAGDHDGAVLCDADLGILAADELRYDEYVAGVRQEYRDVSDEDFRAGRSAVLRRLVDTPHLFTTEHGRRHWEPRARANVVRELASLESA